MKALTIIAVLALIGLMIAGALFVHGRSHAVPGGRAPAGARAPQGQRIRVEVLNATKVRGLARRATQLLRDRGYDVVEVGTSSGSRESTLVLARSGHLDWARRVAASFNNAPVEARPDTSRYVDVTVLIGASWRPPAEPFYP